MRPAHVTLETIARALGVSKMTVSNAYNRPDQLSPALRERVLEYARHSGPARPPRPPTPPPPAPPGTRGRASADPLPYAPPAPANLAILQGMAAECEREGVGMLLVPGAASRPASLDVLRT